MKTDHSAILRNTARGGMADRSQRSYIAYMEAAADEIDHLRRLLGYSEPDIGWRSMDTAPTDGTTVKLRGYFRPDPYKEIEEVKGCYSRAGEKAGWETGPGLSFVPNAWMPIPVVRSPAQRYAEARSAQAVMDELFAEALTTIRDLRDALAAIAIGATITHLHEKPLPDQWKMFAREALQRTSKWEVEKFQ